MRQEGAVSRGNALENPLSLKLLTDVSIVCQHIRFCKPPVEPKGLGKVVIILGDGFTDPREALIKELLVSLENNGSIIVWNQTFEISRLKELARDFPQYEKQLYGLIERVIDEMVPFRKKMFYHPDFNESYSIKKILPVLVPELSYVDLAIQDGGSASLTYFELKNQNYL